jgi:hypothetical protein
LRKYVEDVSGVITGSAFVIDGDSPLQNVGLFGAGHTSNDMNVWITKTHLLREMVGQFAIPYKASKCFSIARNPIDSIPSLVYYSAFLSHSLLPNEQLHVDFADNWNNWQVPFRTESIKQFMKFQHEISQMIPTYFVTYEDLR